MGAAPSQDLSASASGIACFFFSAFASVSSDPLRSGVLHAARPAATVKRSSGDINPFETDEEMAKRVFTDSLPPLSLPTPLTHSLLSLSLAVGCSRRCHRAHEQSETQDHQETLQRGAFKAFRSRLFSAPHSPSGGWLQAHWQTYNSIGAGTASASTSSTTPAFTASTGHRHVLSAVRVCPYVLR